jgi:MoaA/NifB/PqqE/SkfB family radical SAM enzyme
MDGSRPVHDAIRRVPRAFDRLAEGVAAVKARDSGFRVTARCVVQRQNFRDLPNIVDTAHSLGLDQISFLPADVSSQAFNRPTPWDDRRTAEVALTLEESGELGVIVEHVIARYSADFTSGFIAEAPEKFRRIPAYFSAIHGAGDFPATKCNAPWVSTVIEADGTVRPCFFHRRLGNIHEDRLDAILNSTEAIDFRRSLDVRTNETCRRCVCTLHVPPWHATP